MFGLSFKIESKSCVLRFIVLGTLSRISWFILEDDDAGVKVAVLTIVLPLLFYEPI